MKSSRFSHFFTALILATLATAFARVEQNTLQPLRFWFYDAGLSSRSASKPADMVILGIDERFMAGRHPYLAPRDRLAQLLENIALGRPKAIALDVWLDSRINDRSNGDFKLQKALRHLKALGIPLILSDLPPAQTEFGDDPFASDSRSGQTAGGSVIPFFAKLARTGSVIFAPDKDGAVRQHALETPGSPSLPLQMARLASGKPTLNPQLPAQLDFCGPPGTVDTQSAADFLSPELAAMIAPLLKGKLVFIGATYPRSLDYQLTPYTLLGAHPMYGVELLAQVTDSLRRGAPFHSYQTTAALLFDYLLVFAGCFVLALAALRGNLAGVLGALNLLIVAAMSALFSARDGGPQWDYRFHDATPWIFSTLFALVGGIGWRSWKTARELRLVRDTFGAYMGSEILESLGGKMPELGGETREIAVLFCDIRGYSALAESMGNDPKALLDELNAHFSPLVGALKERGAYVDNYVGDLVMALFGAPVSTGSFEADVRAATLAALDFVRLVEARNLKRRETGQIPIEVGIGVHCGVAVVGNMGTRDAKTGGKIHYTAIGDVVNVASRVESATRGQNVPLLVTREVVAALGEVALNEKAPGVAVGAAKNLGGALTKIRQNSGKNAGDAAIENGGLPAWERIGEILVKGRVTPVEIYKIND